MSVSEQRISIDRQSTPAQIARGLTELILRHELPTGRPIRESVLAAELGVSRNTVREAIRILERSGLVRHEMNRGAVVREPSVDDLRDLFEARLAIEVGAAMAAPLPAAALAVRGAFTQLSAALAASDAEAAIASDLAFHTAIVGAVGSSRLTAAFTPLINELRLYLSILAVAENEYDDVGRIAAEHEVIVVAFEAHDRHRAAQEITAHIRGNAARLVALMGSRRE